MPGGKDREMWQLGVLCTEQSKFFLQQHKSPLKSCLSFFLRTCHKALTDLSSPQQAWDESSQMCEMLTWKPHKINF